MGIDINNLTGSETLEELEAALEAVELEEDGGEGKATYPEKTDVEQSAPSADEGKASDQGNEPEGEGKAIASKDGKHRIPYEVLEQTRNEAKAWRERAKQLEGLAAERDKLQAMLDEHGIKPDADVSKLDLEAIEQLADDYPELGKLLVPMARKLEQLEKATTGQVKQPDPQAHPVETALQAVPDLAAWREGDQDRFAFAIHVDEQLKSDPTWTDKPLADRFAEAARRTKAAFGDAVEQATTPASGKETKAPAKDDRLPDSPSALGQSFKATTEEDRYASMSQEELMSHMGSMSPAQIEAMLAKFDI